MGGRGTITLTTGSKHGDDLMPDSVMDPFDRRPSLPIPELLDLLQGNRVELEALGLLAGQRHGVELEVVRRYVRETLEAPLRMGLIRATHTDGTAERPYLTDDLTVGAVLDLAHQAVEAYEDPDFLSLDHDFWIAITSLGKEYLAAHPPTAPDNSKEPA